jgi:N-methylhydantoinase A
MAVAMSDHHGYRLGVDIGGTFTDLVFLGSGGEIRVKKVSSTPDNYARAIGEGIRAVFQEAALRAEQIADVIHGSTVASNAMLERRGARTGLLTTAGFRDVLEIGRGRAPRLYDLDFEKPPPLVPRYLRRVVAERIDRHGRVLRPLDLQGAEREIRRLLDEGIESLAIALLNGYANPGHEQALGALAAKMAPDLYLCLSSEVHPEMREYERTSTTVTNAYVMPVVEKYLRTLERELAATGIRAPLLIMQSNGGVMRAAAAMVKPVHIIESGPAAGVVGAAHIARRLGLTNIVTFDMGGTTAKASIVEDGQWSLAAEMEVGAGANLIGNRLMKGGGYLVRVPAIDIAEVGAGGGSVVWLDKGGAMRVGPRSAGAVPGPVCYAAGGTQPTVTDANVLLGYLNPEYLVGGALRLDADRAARVFHDRVSRPLGLDLTRAAYGAHLIANSNMIRAVKAVSTERGRDPRDYVFFAFGGNGPLHGVGMAGELEMRTVIVPPAPGLFSAFGLLFSDVEHHFVTTCLSRLADLDVAELNRVLARLTAEGEAMLASEGYGPQAQRLLWEAELRYAGQSFELRVPLPAGALTPETVRDLADRFGREHERTYGHRAIDEPVELVSVRLTTRGLATTARVPQRIHVDRAVQRKRTSRQVYFGDKHGWLETPVIEREDLRAGRCEGPSIVEEYDATTVVPPGCSAALDAWENIAIEWPAGRRGV